MKSFGIAMIVLGAFTGLIGLFFAFTVESTTSWSCSADQGSAVSTCSYNTRAGDTDPGTALRTSTGALALCVVGAGLFAGGLAAAAASHPVRPLPAGAGYPPVPGPPPGYGQPAYGQPEPGAYGQSGQSGQPGQQPPTYGGSGGSPS